MKASKISAGFAKSAAAQMSKTGDNRDHAARCRKGTPRKTQAAKFREFWERRAQKEIANQG